MFSLSQRTKIVFAILTGTVVGACGSLACHGGSVTGWAGVVAERVVADETEELLAEPEYFEGVNETRTVTVGGVERKYIIHVPGGVLRKDEVTPVVFAAHYYRGSAEKMQKLTGFDDVEAVVVYLQGVNNSWAPAPYASMSSEEDLAYFDAVRGEVAREFVVSRDSTFVVGFSNGGGFAMHVRCKRPNVVGGVATVAAAFYGTVVEGCAALPVKQIDIHGAKDRLLEYGGGVRYGHSYLGVDEVMGMVAGFNSCIGFVDGSLAGVGGRVRRWESCVAGLEQVLLDEGVHEWGVSGGVDSSPRFATVRIVEFFGLGFVPQNT